MIEEEEEEKENQAHIRSSLMKSANQVALKGFGHVERMGKERRMIREIYESQTATERLKGQVGRGKDQAKLFGERERAATGSADEGRNRV